MLYSVNCVLTVLIIRLENITTLLEPEVFKSMSVIYIQQELLFLRELRELPVVAQALHLLEPIVEANNIPIPAEAASGTTSTNMDQGSPSAAGPSEPHEAASRPRQPSLSWLGSEFDSDIFESFNIVGL